MPYYSELQQNHVQNRNTPFEDKTLLFRQKNRNMFYQLIKYLYDNHNDTSAKTSEGYFCVTTSKSKYVFPSPVNGPAFRKAINDESEYAELVYLLNSALTEIAEFNINSQVLTDRDDRDFTDFEKLEKVRHKTGRKSTGMETGKKRKARFNKRVISPGIQSQLSAKGPHRIRTLLLAYALKMSTEETTALMQTVDPNQPVNIWNGYEIIVFYAITRKDITLDDLDHLGSIMTAKGAAKTKSSSGDEDRDTELTWNSFIRLAELDKDSSIREMEKLLKKIRAANKISSVQAKEKLDSLFEDVLKRADRIFMGSYGKKCLLNDNHSEEEFRKCRDALTEQFWPYYNKQIQFIRQETSLLRDKLVLGYYLCRLKEAGVRELGCESTVSALRNLDQLLDIREGSLQRIMILYQLYRKKEADKKKLPKKSKTLFEKLDTLTDSELITVVRNRITYYQHLKDEEESEEPVDDFYISLREMRSLPTRKHLGAVDDGSQGVTRADLEFAWFLKFALDHPLAEYQCSDDCDIASLIDQRFTDYKLSIDALLTGYHFEKSSAKYRFDDLLMVCMQQKYPVKQLHTIVRDYFRIAGKKVETCDI